MKNYWFFRAIAVVAAVLSMQISVSAQQTDQPKPQTPTVLKGGKVIDTALAKQMAAAKGVFVFDMRSPVNYGKGRLPGAKSLPYREASEFKAEFDATKDQFDLKALPADKAATIMFYSDGPTGWKSYKAATLAIKAGYTNVHYYRNGTDDWVKAGNAFEK